MKETPKLAKYMHGNKKSQSMDNKGPTTKDEYN